MHNSTLVTNDKWDFMRTSSRNTFYSSKVEPQKRGNLGQMYFSPSEEVGGCSVNTVHYSCYFEIFVLNVQ